MTNSDIDTELNEAVRDVPPEKVVRIMKLVNAQVLDDLRRMIKETIVPQSIEIARQQLGYTDAVEYAANSLAHRTSDSREEILLKALSLYAAALEAKQRSQKLVLVGPDFRFIREIIGFDQLPSETSPPASAAK